ncbi:hypothetical protein FTS55_15765 [Salmonella enterica subsp. enterica]|nr:hypothetical protein [Salmonella enterica subsp. enterica serovar Menston]
MTTITFRAVIVTGAECCPRCGATIEYGRIPPRYFLLLAIARAIIGGVHLLCDEAGLRDFLQQLGIATVLCLLFCLKAVAKVHGEGQEQPG